MQISQYSTTIDILYTQDGCFSQRWSEVGIVNVESAAAPRVTVTVISRHVGLPDRPSPAPPPPLPPPSPPHPGAAARQAAAPALHEAIAPTPSSLGAPIPSLLLGAPRHSSPFGAPMPAALPASARRMMLAAQLATRIQPKAGSPRPGASCVVNEAHRFHEVNVSRRTLVCPILPCSVDLGAALCMGIFYCALVEVTALIDTALGPISDEHVLLLELSLSPDNIAILYAKPQRSLLVDTLQDTYMLILFNFTKTGEWMLASPSHASVPNLICKLCIGISTDKT